MGICADHAPNMISTDKSNIMRKNGKGVANRFLQDFPHIRVVHDYTYAFNLVIEEAVSKFPPNTLKMINDICSHFSYSTKRKTKFHKLHRKLALRAPLDIVKYVHRR